MSAENVQSVRRLWDAWERGGIDGLVELVPDDFVAYAVPGWVGESRQVGPEGLRAMLGEWDEAFTDYALELAEVRHVGDRVVALIEQRGVTRESGVAISHRIGAVYSDFGEGGAVREMRFFPNWDEALRAAGP